jgi:hypothetical protein
MACVASHFFDSTFCSSNTMSNKTQENVTPTHLAGVFLGVGVTGGSVA